MASTASRGNRFDAASPKMSASWFVMKIRNSTSMTNNHEPNASRNM
jgi:hypothetical protein